MKHQSAFPDEESKEYMYVKSEELNGKTKGTVYVFGGKYDTNGYST